VTLHVAHLAAFSLLLALAHCGGPRQRFGPTQGPPRLLCRGESIFAWTDTPWLVTCYVDGNLALLPEQVEFRLRLSGQDDYFSSSVISNLDRRTVAWHIVLTRDYWRNLTGNSRIGVDDRNIEVIRRDDPRYPMEPIEGLDASLDGGFRVFVELRSGRKILARGQTVGQLNCLCSR